MISSPTLDIKLHQTPGMKVKRKAQAMHSLSWGLSELENCFCAPLHETSLIVKTFDI